EFSGMDFERNDLPPTSEEFIAVAGEYYHTAIDMFGPDRCMFASNFPVDRLSVSYGVMWNAYKRMGTRYNYEERSWLFHGTAQRVYRLGFI
ncbi:MAG: amidohydrolase family protein, partial [Pontixanthobacter sp.]